MKQKIHPKWYDDCQVTCVCGNSFITGSTLPKIHIEICAACHPFFTGEMKYVDTLGRVEKFKQKQAKIADKKYVKKADRRKVQIRKEEKQAEKQPKNLKEMLQRELKKKK